MNLSRKCYLTYVQPSTSENKLKGEKNTARDLIFADALVAHSARDLQIKLTIFCYIIKVLSKATCILMTIKVIDNYIESEKEIVTH